MGMLVLSLAALAIGMEGIQGIYYLVYPMMHTFLNRP